MKKFLGIFAISGMLVACNNAADSTDNTKDSLDSVEKAAKDTIENVSDRAKDSVDATMDAAKDAVDAKDSLTK